jgi:hypothetical protein
MQSLVKVLILIKVPEAIINLEDLVELFLEIQDTENLRPDFSLVNSNTQLKLLYSFSKKKDSRAKTPERGNAEDPHFTILNENQGKRRIKE